MKPWYRRKTVWAAAGLAASAMLAEFTSMSPEQIKAIQTVVIAASLIFMRDAINGR